MGFKKGDFYTFLEKSGVPVSERTLERWTHAIQEAPLCSTPAPKRGRPPLIDSSEAEILSGYCLSLNEKHSVVTSSTVIDFARSFLGVEISRDTALRFLEDYGFSIRSAKRESSGVIPSDRDLAKVVSDWIREQRAAGLFERPFSKIGSVDFTYTRHTTTTLRTFVPRGRFVLLL